MQALCWANWQFALQKSVFGQTLISVCPNKHPVLSLRGAFCVTKQSPLFYDGIASLKNRLRQKTPRNDTSGIHVIARSVFCDEAISVGTRLTHHALLLPSIKQNCFINNDKVLIEPKISIF